MFQTTLLKNLDELIRLEPEVDAFLAQHDTPAPVAFRVRLALEEIIRNLIEHAPAARQIDVRLEIEADRVVIEIDDDGDYFDLRSAPEFDKSQPLEERRPGGMGIQLVRSLVREIDYQRVPSGNRLRLVIDKTPCKQ
jgi:serine/threonine-protein kinase RsbW